MPLGRTVGLRRQRRRLATWRRSPPAGSLAPRRERAPGGVRRDPRPRAAGAAGRLERDAGREDSGRRHLPRLLDQGRSRTTSPTALGARRMFNRLSARIAVSEAAAWTGRRWFGGDYTIIPNGVDVDAAPGAPEAAPAEELRVLFVGRPEERKGLPVLLTAFGALVEHVPCRLTVIGAEREDVLRYLADPELMRSIDVRGRVSGERLWSRAARRRRALRALALGRELRHGADRGLRRRHPGDRLGDRRLQRRRQRRRRRRAGAARRPAAPGRGAAARPPRAASGWRRWARPPGDSAQRYAWPRVADQVTEVYERAIEAPRPRSAPSSASPTGPGLRPADGSPASRPQKLPSLDPPPARDGKRGRRVARRARARRRRRARHRPDRCWRRRRSASTRWSKASSAPNLTWVLVACALMAASLFFRAASWYWIARAALPEPAGAPPRRHLGDDDRGADVGDPAGPPRRAGARAGPRPPHRPHARDLPGAARDPGLADDARTSSPWSLLGVIIVSTTPLFHSGTKKLFAFSLVPLILLLVVVLLAPLLMRRNGNGRLARIGAGVHRALVQVRAGPRGLPRSAPRRRSRPPRSWAPGRSSSPPAGRCSTRSASTARPGSAPPPRSSSRSTSPPSSRRPRRTSASSSWR